LECHADAVFVEKSVADVRAVSGLVIDAGVVVLASAGVVVIARRLIRRAAGNIDAVFRPAGFTGTKIVADAIRAERLIRSCRNNYSPLH
jgi:hypothetical protein